jgi:peptide/nickel transport system permease protein
LGTNDVGNDVLSELLYGARVSLGIAGAVALASTALSWVIGIAAGLWRRLEGPLIAVADLLLALPHLPLAMLVLLLAGASVTAVTATLALLTWPAFARIVRAQVIAVRAAPYVDAARALGATELRVAVRHVFPATLPLLPAKLVLSLRLALFGEATLAFLGLGDPGAKSWGTMLGWAFNDPLLFNRSAWVWWALPPAMAIAVTMLAASWAAEPLEQAVTPARQ